MTFLTNKIIKTAVQISLYGLLFLLSGCYKYTTDQKNLLRQPPQNQDSAVFAQPVSDSIKTGYLIGFYPSPLSKVNGLLLNYFMSFDPNKQPPDVNGMELQIDPLKMITLPIFGITAAFTPAFYNCDPARLKRFVYKENASRINGIRIGSLFTKSAKVNGISISCASSSYDVNGLSIAVITGSGHKVQGVTLAFKNDDEQCKGVQIGIIELFGKLLSLYGI